MDSAWDEEANPDTAPGVTRKQVRQLVRKLADDPAFYDRCQKDPESALLEVGITVIPGVLNDFRLPSQRDLQEYLNLFGRNPRVWVGIPREAIELIAFGGCYFRMGP